MKTLMLLPVLMLVGCSVLVPVKQKFPDAPPELLTSCNELKLLERNTTKLSVVVESVVENYASYHECRIRLETWKEWYETQKSIFDK
jgi:hypothetical protein